jgi:hypothetical protein
LDEVQIGIADRLHIWLDSVPRPARVGVLGGLSNLLSQVPAAASNFFALPAVVPTLKTADCYGGELDVYREFTRGYYDAGGDSSGRHLRCWIDCESSWQLETDGVFLGLAQFHEDTWSIVAERTGLTDWKDPYHQGFNTATWEQLVSPGTRAGWPVCWWR